MSHAGPPRCPNDPLPDPAANDAFKAVPSRASGPDVPCGVYSLDASKSAAAVDRPIEAARADAVRRRESLPFVVQSGRTLYLVAEEGDDWVLAELRFDAETCTFAEEHRIRFHWPREAFGGLLSRTIVGNDIDAFDSGEAARIADAFTQWMASQYATVQG